MIIIRLLPMRYIAACTFWILALLASGPSYLATAQLSLDTVTPSHGATSISTDAKIEFTFSDVIDTQATFDNDNPDLQDLFLGLDINPDPGAPISVEVNSTGLQISISFSLEPNTQYLVTLTGARSATGAFLDRPYIASITTADSLPSGMVTGKVTMDEGSPVGSLVALFPGSGSLSDNDAIAAAVVLDSLGTYQTDFVPDGAFVVAGFQDRNEDGLVSDPFEDAMGLYDVQNDSVVDPIFIEQGATLNNIDIEMGTLKKTTARQPYPFAQTLAQTAVAGARLGAISAVVDLNGQAPLWQYLLYDPTTEDTVGVVVFGDQFALSDDFLGEENEDDSAGPDLSFPIPDNWIDSKAAVDSVEAGGGAAYRALNAEVDIFALLANLPEGACTLFGNEGFRGRLAIRDPAQLLTELRQFPGKAAKNNNQKAYWVVLYVPTLGFDFPFASCIDAESGTPPPPRETTTARPNLEAAQDAALAWADDAQLVTVAVNPTEGIDTSGIALDWLFAYYSASQNQVQGFFLSDSLVLGQESIDRTELPSIDPLPENWIDSDLATRAADKYSEQFRDRFPDALVSTILGRGLRMEDPSLAVWQFTYLSLSSGSILILDIDALTGLVIRTSVPPLDLPSPIALLENYPNPFSTSTMIPFTLGRPGHVTLSIFDLLGRRITTLFDQVVAPGTYTVPWQPGDLPSGVYVYRLELESQVLTRKMMLQK